MPWKDLKAYHVMLIDIYNDIGPKHRCISAGRSHTYTALNPGCCCTAKALHWQSISADPISEYQWTSCHILHYTFHIRYNSTLYIQRCVASVASMSLTGTVVWSSKYVARVQRCHVCLAVEACLYIDLTHFFSFLGLCASVYVCTTSILGGSFWGLVAALCASQKWSIAIAAMSCDLIVLNCMISRMHSTVVHICWATI